MIGPDDVVFGISGEVLRAGEHPASANEDHLGDDHLADGLVRRNVAGAAAASGEGPDGPGSFDSRSPSRTSDGSGSPGKRRRRTRELRLEQLESNANVGAFGTSGQNLYQKLRFATGSVSSSWFLVAVSVTRDVYVLEFGAQAKLLGLLYLILNCVSPFLNIVFGNWINNSTRDPLQDGKPDSSTRGEERRDEFFYSNIMFTNVNYLSRYYISHSLYTIIREDPSQRSLGSPPGRQSFDGGGPWWRSRSEGEVEWANGCRSGCGR
jgi:hypothetical protein